MFNIFITYQTGWCDVPKISFDGWKGTDATDL